MRSKAKFLLVRQKLLNGKCAVRGETYKYEDREDGEDVSQPAHLLAGRPVVPRHGEAGKLDHYESKQSLTGVRISLLWWCVDMLYVGVVPWSHASGGVIRSRVRARLVVGR